MMEDGEVELVLVEIKRKGVSSAEKMDICPENAQALEVVAQTTRDALNAERKGTCPASAPLEVAEEIMTVPVASASRRATRLRTVSCPTPAGSVMRRVTCPGTVPPESQTNASNARVPSTELRTVSCLINAGIVARRGIRPETARSHRFANAAAKKVTWSESVPKKK